MTRPHTICHYGGHCSKEDTCLKHVDFESNPMPMTQKSAAVPEHALALGPEGLPGCSYAICYLLEKISGSQKQSLAQICIGACIKPSCM